MIDVICNIVEEIMTKPGSDPTFARIELDNPPVNALNLTTRRSLMDQIEAALAEPTIKGVIISGARKRFSGGADVTEFNRPEALSYPLITDIGAMIEKAEKPVVAAIDGLALGGGLELALFCHYRVAAAESQIGLPEVKLGVLPGGGGTQRLPRLIGAEAAISMMTMGRTISAEEAVQIGLVDELAADDLLIEAEALLRRRLSEGKALKPAISKEIDIADAPKKFFAAARAQARALKRGPAPEAIVDCVEAAATLSVADAAEFEKNAFVRLSQTSESLALRHLFFAERKAARIAGLPSDTRARTISSVGVIGAGTMGTGIAMAFANSGFPVALFDSSAEAMFRSRVNRTKAYSSAQKRGRMTATEAERAADRIVEHSTIVSLGDCDLVVEAVIEDASIKKQLIGKLSSVLKQDAIIASNTSYLDINELAMVTDRPENVLGLHFFSPAHIMRLVEVVRGSNTSNEVLATAMATVKRLGKIGVVAGVCDGFIGNRMVDQYFLRANELLMEGATPEQVDAAIRRFGFAMGPFTMSDMAGNDIAWLTRQRRAAQDPNFSYPLIADAIAERGWLGQKSGQGYYGYEEGSRDPITSPEVEALLRELRVSAGITPREIDETEIVDRCLHALINEGCRIIAENVAQRASDVDVVYVRGYGFPDLKGGPMHWAEQQGLAKIADAIEQRFQTTGDPAWKPSPRLIEAAEAGYFGD
ncbi:3-hydroxyacyl-CoA dehydrogenase NAD-binding domain-containing protein [Paracoccus sp. SCSIO 75233]|uniref:3-hydroxyacyl-CoA dehydrogenase NAD-binding domain-containing protein n=1 Tax=Paracoccus sp. SCSIO 75233 TaxID=3017782 RepID=UPI0022F03522|nr:3-hydroxyacyl-CoA dehydrogenase NAD-binding domain-containing protein [Paracoccus sp. SCSIO 75233]WBU52993.1 3-hydroxyacyl-CoA dehydrogenase NAD-binding domain-containing protein [Paracoccus sp. SCSIO 75233]